MYSKSVKVNSLTDSPAAFVNASLIQLDNENQVPLHINSEYIFNSKLTNQGGIDESVSSTNDKPFAPDLRTQDSANFSRKKRHFRQYCSALNCNANTINSPDSSFFRFPKDKERCQRWLINVQRQDLSEKSPETLYHCNRLCGRHFEDAMFSNNIKTRLYFHAVPTLADIPSSSNSLKQKNFSKVKFRNKKANEHCDQNMAKTSLASREAEETTMENDLIMVLTSTEMAVMTNNLIVLDDKSEEIELPVPYANKIPEVNENIPDCKKSCMCIECQPENYKGVGTQTDPFVSTKEEKKRVAIQMKMLKRKIRNLERRLQRSHERLEKEPEITTEKAMEKLKNELPIESYYLLQSMLKVSKEKYSEQEKKFFLDFYFQARNGYQFLREKQIHMPHPKTVQKWKREIQMESECVTENVGYEENVMIDPVEQFILEQNDNDGLAYSIAIISNNTELDHAQEDVHYCLI